jgi:KipI family sensor histidine kinase inhibitor
VSGWRIRDAGDSALLLEFEAIVDATVNDRAIAAADAFRRRMLAGVRDVLSTYRSVAVHFDPLIAEPVAVRAALEQAADAPASSASGRIVEIPVTYGGADGPDIDGVAAFAGIDATEVAGRHAATIYRVFMLGFLPGFPYLGSVDPSIGAPRHRVPRTRVPAGSVGIAGRQTGIYPIESPGGWQIIGRTPVRMFDLSRTPPALLQPGDAVRFVPRTLATEMPNSAIARAPAVGGAETAPARVPGTQTCTVLRPGLFTTVQDWGRWGFQRLGVPVSGALDAAAHARANALVGNDPRGATLEVTIQGPELRFDTRTDIAIAGGDLEATLDGSGCPLDEPIRCRTGATLRFGTRRRGARAYVAVAGGIDTVPELGSRATHVRTRIGGLAGRALLAGDTLPIGSSTGDDPSATWPDTGRQSRAYGRRGGSGPVGVRLRVLPGPQEDFFGSDALELLQVSRFVVAPTSDRMGYRLQASRPIPAAGAREMISDATFPGGIQVPPSGHPILLLADRQTTGGYPQIAVVIAADLPLAGQLVPGDWIELRVCSRHEAIRALAEAREAGRVG